MSSEIETLEAVIAEEASRLDDARWEDWLDLFSANAWYWVPHRIDQPNPFDEVSIFYDDRMLMETRVRRLTLQNSHAQSPPTRTLRVLSRPRKTDPDDPKGAEAVLETRFTMAEYRLGAQKMWAGIYTHGLSKNGEDWKINWKRVDLVNADSTVDGLSIPF